MEIKSFITFLKLHSVNLRDMYDYDGRFDLLLLYEINLIIFFYIYIYIHIQ